MIDANKYAGFFGILLLAGCAGSGNETIFPPSEAFRSPPYTMVEEGLRPELADPVATMPSLEPGEAVVFACDSETGMVSGVCEVPLEIAVWSPLRGHRLLMGEHGSHVATTKAACLIGRSDADGRMVSTQGAVRIAGQRHDASMQSARSGRNMVMDQAGGGMETRAAEAEVYRIEERLATGVRQRDGDTLTQAGESGGLRSRQAIGALAKLQEEGGRLEARDSIGTLAGMEQAHGRMESVGASGSLAASSARHALGAVVEEGLIGAEIISGLMEGMMRGGATADFWWERFERILHDKGIGLLEGLFDGSLIGIPHGGFVVSDMERRAFLVDLLRGATLYDLLHRADNLYLRDDFKGRSGSPRLAMSFALVAPKVCHHGGMALIELSIKNTGDQPAFDVLAVNRVPENTAFVQFLAKQEQVPPWLVRGWLKEKDLLYWRLYEPLMPGHTFKSVFLVKFDEWNVFHHAASNRN